MEISDPKTPHFHYASQLHINDIIDALFHDAQNDVHRVGMELELARMGLGDGSDAANAGEMIHSLESTIRDLRGYISALQEPFASCDLAAVLDGVIASLRIGHRKVPVKVAWTRPDNPPLVSVHRKLLARVLERIVVFSENLMEKGGELRIAVGPENPGRRHAEVKLTLTSAAPMPIDAGTAPSGKHFDLNQTSIGVKRALEVLRRHRGEIASRTNSDRRCEIVIRIPTSPS
jgi:signal transduction histidine kinase